MRCFPFASNDIGQSFAAQSQRAAYLASTPMTLSCSAPSFTPPSLSASLPRAHVSPRKTSLPDPRPLPLSSQFGYSGPPPPPSQCLLAMISSRFVVESVVLSDTLESLTSFFPLLLPWIRWMDPFSQNTQFRNHYSERVSFRFSIVIIISKQHLLSVFPSNSFVSPHHSLVFERGSHPLDFGCRDL